jgi:hypothetical protein
LTGIDILDSRLHGNDEKSDAVVLETHPEIIFPLESHQMPHPVIACLLKKFFHLKAIGWTACKDSPYLPTLIKLMKVFVKKKMIIALVAVTIQRSWLPLLLGKEGFTHG